MKQLVNLAAASATYIAVGEDLKVRNVIHEDLTIHALVKHTTDYVGDMAGLTFAAGKDQFVAFVTILDGQDPKTPLTEDGDVVVSFVAYEKPNKTTGAGALVTFKLKDTEVISYFTTFWILTALGMMVPEEHFNTYIDWFSRNGPRFDEMQRIQADLVFALNILR